VDPETSVDRGAERDRYWAGAEAETLHRTRYLPAERLYLAEVDPVAFVDVAIDNTVFDRPVVL
jgi:uridine kinase